MEGTVVAGTNNLFTVECEDEVTRNCTIKGKVVKTEREFYNPIAPGDKVEIEPDSLNDEKGQIIKLQERKSALSSLVVGKNNDVKEIIELLK